MTKILGPDIIILNVKLSEYKNQLYLHNIKKIAQERFNQFNHFPLKNEICSPNSLCNPYSDLTILLQFLSYDLLHYIW